MISTTISILDGEKRIPVTPEQEEDFKKLEKLGGCGYAAADLKRRKTSLSQETLTAVDDDDTEADFFEIDEDPVLNLAQPPIMLTSRLVREKRASILNNGNCKRVALM